jgi:hypothetical protein
VRKLMPIKRAFRKVSQGTTCIGPEPLHRIPGQSWTLAQKPLSASRRKCLILRCQFVAGYAAQKQMILGKARLNRSVRLAGRRRFA